jgi:large subunit ribosomal protein L4
MAAAKAKPKRAAEPKAKAKPRAKAKPKAGGLKAPYLSGQKKADLDPVVFSEPFHNSLVHEAVRAELAARRRGTASTRTRGEIAMTGAKAWRQKGTGRARAGALSTPQRVGGGVAFGPKPRRFTVKVNRKARRRALRAALSAHAARDSLAVVDPAQFETPSTKKAAQAVAGGESARTLVALVLGGGADMAAEEGCAKSFRNLAGVTVMPVDAVGVADVVAARRLVLSPGALERLQRIAVPGAVDRGGEAAEPAGAEASS